VLQAELADLLALLMAPLGAGVAPPVALVAALAASSPVSPRLRPLYRDLQDSARAGDGAGAVWLVHARELSSADVRFVARAWLLTERTGAPLAEALAVAESVLRARLRARARLDVVAAGPRASMAVLALLPLGAPLVGLAFGLGPGSLYLSSPAGGASAGLGLALAGLGWWWGRRILTAAIEPSSAHPEPPPPR
jgi:tight adherence protein B